MNDEKEVRIAWEIWKLMNQLNDLFFNHYHEGFQDLWSEEQDDLLEDTDAPSATKPMEEGEI